MGTNREAGLGCVCAGAMQMLSCRSHYRAGFYREGSVFPDTQGGGEGHMVEEPRGQPMKMQVP